MYKKGVSVYAVLGVLHFDPCSFLVLVTDRELAAKIEGKSIYSVDAVKLELISGDGVNSSQLKNSFRKR